MEYGGWKPRAVPSRVYYGLIVNYELDVLEVQLAELADVVDVFVIAEGDRSLSNQPKRLYYNESKARYRKYEERTEIRHVINSRLPDEMIPCPAGPGHHCWGGHWIRETSQRNAIWEGTKDARPEDIIFTLDVDECVSRDAVAAVKYCEGWPAPVHFYLIEFWFHLNIQSIHKDGTPYWHTHPYAMYKKNFTDHGLMPDEIRRRNRKNDRIWDYEEEMHAIKRAGWHLSYFGGVEAVKTKLQHAAHQEHNTPQAIAKIDECRRIGCNIFGWDMPWEHTLVRQEKEDLPTLIREDPDRWTEMFHPDPALRWPEVLLN